MTQNIAEKCGKQAKHWNLLSYIKENLIQV